MVLSHALIRVAAKWCYDREESIDGVARTCEGRLARDSANEVVAFYCSSTSRIT
jgi:hypothetical protein